MAREQLVEERYNVLRLVITIIRGVGILQIVGAVIVGFGMALSEQKTPTLAGLRFDSLMMGVFAFLMVGFSGLITYGFGELIQVVIDIEENTRATERATSAAPDRLRSAVHA